ncbi:MAG: NUDIX hydrolase [Tepidisphaeraceae bacterium]
MSYELRERQTIYSSKRFQLEIHHLDRLEDGKRVKREVIVHGGSVVILPLLSETEILLIRNYRYAVRKYLLELPAGTLEKGEDPTNCAGRELQEETGYLAGRIKSLGHFYASPGITSEKMYAFAAYDLQKTVQNLDEGEEIEVVPTKIDDALAMIRTGEIEDGKTIAALLMWRTMGTGK